jgi:hypothetical protein
VKFLSDSRLRLRLEGSHVHALRGTVAAKVMSEVSGDREDRRGGEDEGENVSAAHLGEGTPLSGDFAQITGLGIYIRGMVIGVFQPIASARVADGLASMGWVVACGICALLGDAHCTMP